MRASMKITDGKGVYFTLENGITLSIQIGGGNYSDNYNEPISRRDMPEGYTLPASTRAEIAMWDSKGDWVDNLDGDMVKGYVPVTDVLRFIEFLRTLPSDLTASEIELAIRAFDWRETVAA